MGELPHLDTFILQDIKKEPVNASDIELMYAKVGSYEQLINKRAQLYKERDLKNKVLTEEDFKALLLEHYTFLSRPVIVIDEQVYVGNSKKVIEEAINYLNK